MGSDYMSRGREVSVGDLENANWFWFAEKFLMQARYQQYFAVVAISVLQAHNQTNSSNSELSGVHNIPVKTPNTPRNIDHNGLPTHISRGPTQRNYMGCNPRSLSRGIYSEKQCILGLRHSI